MADQSARLIDVEWDGDTTGAMFVASIEVKALDRSRLLRDVSNALSDHHVNIVACTTHTGSDRIAKMRFEFELGDPAHLDAVLRTIKSIDAVYDAYRIVPGGGRLTSGTALRPTGCAPVGCGETWRVHGKCLGTGSRWASRSQPAGSAATSACTTNGAAVQRGAAPRRLENTPPGTGRPPSRITPRRRSSAARTRGSTAWAEQRARRR